MTRLRCKEELRDQGNLSAEHRLRASELIEEVSLRTGQDAHHARIRLSVEGHQLVRRAGLHAFRQRLQELLPDQDATPLLLDFCPDLDGECALADSPAILSMLVQDSGSRKLLLEVDSALGWFSGHFPGHPVLPGIVQVHWAVRFSSSHLGFERVPVEIHRLKFKKVVHPMEILELSISKYEDTAVAFEYTCAGQPCSEGRLIYRENAR